MRIEQLTLKNFRCFADQEFHFHPKMNVLIGQNGAGKTAIMEALATAIGSWLIGIGGFVSTPIRTIDVRLKPIQVGEVLTFEEQYPVIVAADGIIDGKRVPWQRTLARRGSKTTNSDVRQLREIALQADSRVRAGEPITLPVIAYYGSGRLWRELRDRPLIGSETKQNDLSRLAGYRDSIDDRISSRDLMRWLARQDYIAYHEHREPKLLTAVKSAMREMLDGASEIGYDPKREEVVVHFVDAEPMPFKNLSDGQRNLLALAGDLAVRMATLNPQFGSEVLRETPGVVLIDELDLHLHPQWQREIVHKLEATFPNCQFIVTTHSPLIMQQVQADRVTIIGRDGSTHHPTSTYGVPVEEILEMTQGTPPIDRDQVNALMEALDDFEVEEADRIWEAIRSKTEVPNKHVSELLTLIGNTRALLDDSTSEEAAT